MEFDINQEREILARKKNKIFREIDEKNKYKEEVSFKLKQLTKEAKGSYNQDKVNTEKIFEIIKKDIENYEEAINNPYFARIDFNEKFGDDEEIYIGKMGISSSADGEEVVVDWRAPVADLYYSGTGGEASYRAPMGLIEGDLTLKRKFLFKDGDIERIFDEGINDIIINNEEGQDLVDEFLKINLEESRGKKLKEVVATIQREQNQIIRWPKNLPLIVQGSAGSGKTTIALHRLAYLIYRYRETMEGKDILVLAPNKLFLDYISEILPSLGSHEVVQTTFQDLVVNTLKLKGKIKSKDDKLKEIIESDDEALKKYIINSSKVKGNLVYKIILNRYITLLESSSLEIKDIEVQGYVLFTRREILRLYLKDLKSYPINKRKDEIKRYLLLKLKERIEVILQSIDREWDIKIKTIKLDFEDGEERRRILLKEYDERDEIKANVKTQSRKVINEYFKNWRGITSKDIYIDFFRDDEVFELVTDNKIPKPLAEFMKKEIIENFEKNIVDEDDLAPLMFIHYLLEGIEENSKFKHIVVDEAQDYSPFQVDIINNIAKGNSLTLVGDIAQGIYHYKGIKSWDDVIKGVFDGNSTYISLSQSYRSTVEIIDFAQGVLEAQNLGLQSAKPVLRHGPKPEVHQSTSRKNSVEIINNIITEIKEEGKRSVAIITRTFKEAKDLEKDLKKNSKFEIQVVKGNEKGTIGDIVIIPSYLTKGLEFDGTIIFNPLSSNYEEGILNNRLLYVALTRALHYEYIVSEGELQKNIRD